MKKPTHVEQHIIQETIPWMKLNNGETNGIRALPIFSIDSRVEAKMEP